MLVDNFRTLVALRYAAESVDEVNVFLARALEVQLNLKKQTAIDRIVGYFGGTAAVVVGAFSIGGDFIAPALTLATYLILMAFTAVFRLCQIIKQQKELALDRRTVRDYLRKATRDRQENRVSVAIQNRKAARRLLDRQHEELESDDVQFLKDSVKFWGDRIEETANSVRASKDDEVWTEDTERLKRILDWAKKEVEIKASIT